MKTIPLSKGKKTNKRKKKQLTESPNDADYEISVNKSAKFNFNEQCNFDISSPKRKLGISSDERTDSIDKKRTDNSLIVDKNLKKKRKSIKSEFEEDTKELQIGLSKKHKRKKAIGAADEDEEAESVDSGCVDDGSTESLPDALELPTDWVQILSSVVAEHNFVKDLLSVVPSRKHFDISEHIETNDSLESENAKKKDTEDDKIKAKPTRVTNYEELTRRLEERLHTLKKNRKTKKERQKTRKQQQKLKTKMKILATKNKKRNKIKEEEPENEGVKKKAAVQSGDGQLVFSKFDFTKPISTKNQANKGKDLQHILSKALKEKEKVKKLEVGGDLERATELKDKKAWKGALMRADGKKVLDDIDLMKKSAKKKEKKKKSSKDKWEKRSEKLKEKMAAEEKKRKDNLRARKQDRLKNKMKKMNKKGHIVPGF